MKRTKLLYVVIAILVVFQIYSLFKINGLNTSLQQTDSRIASVEDRLERNINVIYSNVDRKLEEYTSLVTSSGYEIGKFNPQTLKVPITFKLQPKVLTETMGVFLKFDQEKVPMEKQGTEFVLTKDFGVQDEILPTIIIEDKGTLQFGESDSLKVYNIKDEIFSSLSPRFEGETSYNSRGPYEYHMKGNIAMYPYLANGDNSFKDIRYIVTLDDEVIKTYQADFIGVGDIEINDNFKMKRGQKITGKVLARDKYNLTHEYVIMTYIGGEWEENFYHYENEKIISPRGTVIYEYNENDLY